MKLSRKLLAWSCGWSRAQIAFIVFYSAFWMAVGCIAVIRQHQACDEANYWREYAVTNQVYRGNP